MDALDPRWGCKKRDKNGLCGLVTAALEEHEPPGATTADQNLRTQRVRTA